jgi:hypothetical protein
VVGRRVVRIPSCVLPAVRCGRVLCSAHSVVEGRIGWLERADVSWRGVGIRLGSRGVGVGVGGMALGGCGVGGRRREGELEEVDIPGKMY